MTLYTRVIVNVTKRIKSTHFAVQVTPSIFDSKHNYPTKPITHSIAQWDYLNKIMLTEKCVPPFYQLFFLFGSGPKTYLSHVRYLFFFFILVHTQVRLVKNYYIINHIMKKHNFTWMYILNFLIVILSFFSLNSQ